jgi:hypothetical protein
VLLAYYRAGREVEVTGIGVAATVNGVLNGAIIGLEGGGRKCARIKGGNDGLDRSGHLHGVGGGRRGGFGVVAREGEAEFDQHR